MNEPRPAFLGFLIVARPVTRCASCEKVSAVGDDEEDEAKPAIDALTAHLLEITDLDVVSYFNFKAYHNANPSPSDQPIYCRSSTLEYKKKAISSFLPHQNMPWDNITQKGNPTRSKAVHHMIQKVKVHEV